jgi:hypothetical protein
VDDVVNGSAIEMGHFVEIGGRMAAAPKHMA